MAKTLGCIHGLLLPTICIMLLPFSQGCGITVYWGQSFNEHSLQEACSSGYYQYVAVAFLTTFGSGQPLDLNLGGHCYPSAGTCVTLASEIRYCQNVGVKVLLSLGGSTTTGRYGLTSANDAKLVAASLWGSYLSGKGGPLGDAALDGVDFDIQYPVSNKYWDDLARAIAGYSTPQRKILLSASPQCAYPDVNLDAAIRTGLFDFVWVQFYNNPQCDFSGGLLRLTAAWKNWSSALPSGTKLFLGLPAAPEAAGRGYIAPDTLKSQVLPFIKDDPKYGGVMLWNRLYDNDNTYSPSITAAVCTNAVNTTATATIAQVV